MAGRKTTDAEGALRVSRARELLIEHASRKTIIPTLAQEFGVTERQAYHYYAKAWAKQEKIDDKNMDAVADVYRQRLENLYDDLKEKDTAEGANVAVKILEKCAILHGLPLRQITVRGDKANPIEVNHTHAMEIDYSKVSTAALQELLAAAIPKENKDE